MQDIEGTRRGNPYLSGRHVARNVLWNFAGLLAPALAAIVAIPLLIESIGKERFGLLAIIWMGVGYFSLFDLGFGRALTKLIAERMATRQVLDLPSLIWTAVTVIFAIGVVGATLVALSSGALVSTLLNVNPLLQTEAIEAFRILAIGLPFVVVTSALIGILEAHQRFVTITTIRVPLGILTFAGPLATAQVTPSLAWATAVLLGARIVAFFVYFVAAASVAPELKTLHRFDGRHVRTLAHFGGWLTVTNIVGPLMVYFDRFFVGSMMNMTAVAYYVTPYEILSRTRLLPQSIIGVLFPVLTTAVSTDRERLVTIYSQTQRTLFLIMLPIFSTLFLLGPEILQIWLGADFRIAGTPVLRWLTVGWLINTLARMPFTVLQSAGRPDVVAKTHLIELIPYAVALWYLTKYFGIAGTAAAWFMRVLTDTVVLNLLVEKQLGELRRAVYKALLVALCVIVGFALVSQVESLLIRVVASLTVGVVSASGLWPVCKQLLVAGPATPQVEQPKS